MTQPDLYQSMIKESLQEQQEEEDAGQADEEEEMELEDDFDIAEYIHSMPMKLKQ